MSAISLKSITGITSITTPTGVDNQLTLHNNNTTEAVKLDVAGNLHFHNHLNITGISTAANFKTGTSNLHNTGLNVQDLDVDGHTNLDNVSIAGVSTFSGDVLVPDKIIHSGDTNTFIRFPDAGDIISMTVGNYEKVKIELGDITITNAHLSLVGDGRTLKLGAASDFQLSHTGTVNKIQSFVGDIDYMSPNGSGHSFQINSQEKLRIKSDGKVLIGATLGLGGATSNPSGLLHCQAPSGEGLIKVIGATNAIVQISGYNGDSTIQFGDSSSDGPGKLNYDHGTDSLAIATNGSERLRITSSGDLGIGYDSPTVKLHVREGASGFSGTYDNRYHIICENSGEAYLGFYVPDNSFAGIRFSDTTGTEGYLDYYFNTDEMVYYSSAIHKWSTAGSERLRITSGGYVNIGGDYTQTSYNLSVTNTGGNLLRLKTANEGDYDLRFMIQNSEANIWHYGTDDLTFGARYDRKVSLIQNGSKRLTINGDLIGINNTSPAKNLHVTSSGVATLRIETTDSRGQAWDLLSTNGASSNTGTLSFRDESGSAYLEFGANGGSPKLQMNLGGANALFLLDDDGNVTKPYQPRALVKISSNTTIGNAKITNWASPTFNVGSLWNAANSRFIAPIDGLYMIGGVFRIGAPGHIRVVKFNIQVYNTSNSVINTYGGGVGGSHNYDDGSGGYDHPYVSFTNVIYLTTGQYLELHCSETATQHTSYIQVNNDQSHMWCVLLQ